MDKNYLYDNTVEDAENILAEGIQLSKTGNLKIKRRLDDSTIIYYVKSSGKKCNDRTNNKRVKNTSKTKIKKKAI